MSKYFLHKYEQLTHGAEILALSIGKAEYKQIEEKKMESEYFSFQMVCEAIAAAFPDENDKIIGGLIEMLTFDALIGHNDRHPYNWGIIVPLRKDRKARFAPVFDTARALFWNKPEKSVVTMLTNKASFESYIKKCQPPIGWDNKKDIDFFELISLIWKEFPFYRKHIEKFLNADKLTEVAGILDKEFGNLLSAERRELIKRCLHLRQSRLKEAIISQKGQ